MESGEEDSSQESVTFKMKPSPEEGSFLFSNGKETTNGDESGEEDLFNNTSDSLGLVSANTPELERVAKNRHQKDLNLLSSEAVAKLSDERLEKMSIQDLNKLLRQLPVGLVQSYKKRRRILKNRKYALKCRRRVSDKGIVIAQQNMALQLDISRAKEDLRNITRERDEYKEKYARLNKMVAAMQSSQMAASKHLLK